jgi:hypothetical protein
MLAQELHTPVKWGTYVEFQQNTKSFRTSQRKAAKMAQVLKSGNVEGYIQSQKESRQKKEIEQRRRGNRKSPDQRTRAKKRIRAKQVVVSPDEGKSCDALDASMPNPTVHLYSRSDDVTSIVEPAALSLSKRLPASSAVGPPSSSIAGPAATSLVIDPTKLKPVTDKGTFVSGGSRATTLKKQMSANKHTRPRHAKVAQLSDSQKLRKAAMEDRAKVWEDHKQKTATNAARKVQRTWRDKQLKKIEVHILRKKVVFDDEANPVSRSRKHPNLKSPSENNLLLRILQLFSLSLPVQELRPVNFCIKETGLLQYDLRNFQAAFDAYDIDLSGEIDYVEFW